MAARREEAWRTFDRADARAEQAEINQSDEATNLRHEANAFLRAYRSAYDMNTKNQEALRDEMVTMIANTSPAYLSEEEFIEELRDYRHKGKVDATTEAFLRQVFRTHDPREH